jgi:hypothetical protein
MNIPKLASQSSSEAELSAAIPTVPNFQHQPIASSSQIRIFILHPPPPDDPEALSGELVTVSLEDKPVYEALSYCWGAPDNSERLHLPEGQLLITANLAAGLRQLRFLDGSRRLWVDAICINQKDNGEKGPQVALMAQVFRNAECVLVWLGVGNSAIYEAIEFINDAADDSKTYGVQPELTFAANVTTFPNNEEGQALTELLNRTDPANLGLFFGQAWFRRLWIVQEFVLASKFAFYNGTSTLYEQAFATALAIFFRMHKMLGRSLVDYQALVAVGSLIETRDCFLSRSGEESSLLLFDVVETHADRECTNDLDLIYGVLGLSTPYQDIELEIDYNIVVEDLFIRFARKYLDRGYLEAFPRGNQLKEWSPVTSGLPSWVPDWKNKLITSYFPRHAFPQPVASNRS